MPQEPSKLLDTFSQMLEFSAFAGVRSHHPLSIVAADISAPFPSLCGINEINKRGWRDDHGAPPPRRGQWYSYENDRKQTLEPR